MNKLRQNKKGFSLIELLLVLGIIAALAITAFMIYPKVSSSSNAKTEISNINTIKASVNSIYSSSPDYTGLTTDVAIKAKVFPETMVNKEGNSVSNIFKGAVTIETYRWSPTYAANSSFKIIYSSVPPEECIKIVSGVANNFYQITIDGTRVKKPKLGAVAGIDLNISKLTNACEAGNTTIALYSL